MKLIFLHIPKCGGNTFHTILERMYRGSVIHDIKVVAETNKLTIPEFEALSADKKESITVLKGHMPFGLHKHFKERTNYITFLREPVDRILSHYNFAARKEKHYLHDVINKKKLSLIDYAMSDLTVELDNHQSRMLADAEGVEINQFTEELFNRAVENLKNHFVAIGLTEEFDKSLILFKEKLGWKQYPFYETINSRPEGSGVSVISNDVRARIEERNHWDMKLYRWAKNEFDNTIKEMRNLDEELKILNAACEAFREGIVRNAKTVQSQGSLKRTVLKTIKNQLGWLKK